MRLWPQALCSWLAAVTLLQETGRPLCFAAAQDRPAPRPRPRPRKKRKAKRKGSGGGYSGQRCTICQAVVQESLKAWKREKEGKAGSPYHYIGSDSPGSSPEDRMMKSVKRVVCNRGFLNDMPNPRGYAIHAPTIVWECDSFFEEQGEALLDALTLGEEMRVFCWDQEVCGSDDPEVFDLTPEDDNDIEDDPEL
eukprot:TRINITY_DN121915_c0_g1_i1.p1 TRINITY_DN121915_c0_g1~~TRINITY_DN121915_c0_g1_i1.p1  ORF type:complete len:194 (+),score=38.60 TRINITY_DN121915_c0_g1_i1:61-642(+)